MSAIALKANSENLHTLYTLFQIAVLKDHGLDFGICVLCQWHSTVAKKITTKLLSHNPLQLLYGKTSIENVIVLNLL